MLWDTWRETGHMWLESYSLRVSDRLQRSACLRKLTIGLGALPLTRIMVAYTLPPYTQQPIAPAKNHLTCIVDPVVVRPV